MTYSLLPILPVVDDVLFNFAQSDEFWANLAIAFGTSYDVVETEPNDTFFCIGYIDFFSRFRMLPF